MTNELKIQGINGPVVTIPGSTGLSMMEMVYVGENHLIGEVIGITDKAATVQVYESTTSLRPGEPVEATGNPMRCMLAPGLLTGIYDGIGRPLDKIEAETGAFIGAGVNIPTVDCEKKWNITVRVKTGDTVKTGDIYAACPETESIEHRMVVPPEVAGEVVRAVPSGEYTVLDELVAVKTEKGIISLNSVTYQPIREPRPVERRMLSDEPLVTGQRIIDTMFPIAKGGAAAIPGGFGTGKTMLQHQLAKWSAADIIVYIGCGERGNEMTQVLTEFSELVDPKTGRSMLERTVLIANTSNMPVAAREASIYTGVTIAEYYRDMGYDVAVMADSTSRWAEALREISGRLEEMPAEEGFPAYLPSRLSAFYERAGYMRTLSGDKASVTIIGAVSPQGSDFSEPVTQNTKRFIRCFWALDKSLAYARHYPAVNWINSYSEYQGELSPWFDNSVAPDFSALRVRFGAILQEEDRLMEIVKLIGSDLLANDQKLTLEIAKCIRVGFLQQNAYIPSDAYVPIRKQYLMMKAIIDTYDMAKKLTKSQIPVSVIAKTGVFEKLIKLKFDLPNDDEEAAERIMKDITKALEELALSYTRE